MAKIFPLRVKRVSDTVTTEDGLRCLVDRLWPRGLKKEKAKVDLWLKEVAPTDGLRRWFGHDPKRWVEFQKRYIAELNAHPNAWQPILEAYRTSIVSLLYGARDTERNNAVVLRNYLATQLRPKR